MIPPSVSGIAALSPRPVAPQNAQQIAAAAPKKFSHHLLAGSVGGIVGLIVSYPFDTTRVRMQCASAGEFSGMIDCMRKIFAEGGFPAFYRGVTSPIAGMAAIKGTVFGSRALLEQGIRFSTDGNSQSTRPLSELEKISKEGGTGLVASAVVAPVERVKVAMQVQSTAGGKKMAYRSTFHCFTTLLKTGGIRSVYSGATVTAMREVPSYGFYFYTYEKAKSSFSPVDGSAIDRPRIMLCGAIAGIMAWLPVYPIDVVKSKIQAQGVNKEYTGIVDCATKIYKIGGHAAFWRGLLPTICRAVPMHATVFLAVEEVLRILRKWDV